MTASWQIPLKVAYWVLIGLCGVFCLGWLAVGAEVAMAAQSPALANSVHGDAIAGSRYALGILAGIGHSEPFGQALLDYAFSLTNLTVAVLLLASRPATWVSRLMALAMVSSAGAFNLQAHAGAIAVRYLTGLDIEGAPRATLHGVACAAYIGALLLYPSDKAIFVRYLSSPWLASLGIEMGVLSLACLATVTLPITASCALTFGFLVPLTGTAVLPHRMRHGETAAERTRARLMLSVLLATLGTSVALAALSLVLSYLHVPGINLIDPSAPNVGAAPAQPTAMLFWSARLATAAIAAAVLIATRRDNLRSVERLFSRGLASAIVVLLFGSGYVVVRVVIARVGGGQGAVPMVGAAAVATVLIAGCLPLAYRYTEPLVDRLLYGRRPTPYSVLADVAALARIGSTAARGGLDLSRLAETIGRGLNARFCRLTVFRPGLRERIYEWSESRTSSDALDDELELPVSQGGEQIGAIAVDAEAAAGLRSDRRTLLTDLADSLGPILQTSRLGIELERQLEAARSHSEHIAAARRLAVAEMDQERRTIERDLHDGAQHHLGSLSVILGLVEHRISAGQLDQARSRLEQLRSQIETTSEVLAKTASGVSSAVLSAQGLAAALHADLADPDTPVRVELETNLTGLRFPPQVEVAVYFCCLESVNNARKHAPGAPITVRAGIADRQLWFWVSDQGPGFDGSNASGAPGRGHRNLTMRMKSVGGDFTIDSALGAGTNVRGSVPVDMDEAALAVVTEPATEATTSGAADSPRSEVSDDSLLSQVHSLLRLARDVLGEPSELGQVRILQDRLDAPLRVKVVGHDDEVAALIGVLGQQGSMPRLNVTDRKSAPDDETDDVLVRCVDSVADLDAGSPGADGNQTSVVVGVVGQPDLALTRPDYHTILTVATDLARTAQVLRALLITEVAHTAYLLRARSTLAALEQLARSTPRDSRDTRLLYQIEQTRSGAHELREMALAEAIRADPLAFSPTERDLTVRLLGAHGRDPRTRLDLHQDTETEAVRGAAAEQLLHWQRLVAHPTSTQTIRQAAHVLIRTCEEILVQTRV
jgi:signal transduction histidine kinase